MSGLLTHSPAKILRQLLVDLGHGTLRVSDGNWPIAYGNEPNKPDNVITVTETQGTFNGRTMAEGQVQEHYGSQVRVRGTNEQVAYAKSNAVAIGMDEDVVYNSVTISGSTYTVYTISRKSGPLSIGKSEDGRRNIFTINVTMAIRQLT